MLFSRPLILDSALRVAVARSRVREFATSRGLPEIEAFRRRQIIGWRLSESNEDDLFQPEYGDYLDIDGARFVGLVEAQGDGSRIRGFIVLSPLIRIVMSLFMLAVVLATAIAIAEARERVASVLSIAATIVAAMMLMVRYTLRSTSRIVEDRLRRYLEQPVRKVAA